MTPQWILVHWEGERRVEPLRAHYPFLVEEEAIRAAERMNEAYRLTAKKPPGYKVRWHVEVEALPNGKTVAD